MAVSRSGKRGTRAGHMVPESRNRRVLRNAGLARLLQTPKPAHARPVVRPLISTDHSINGEKHGRLTAIAAATAYTAPNGATIKRWKFRCECGTEAILLLHRVRNGAIKDCGCVEKERLASERPKVEARLRPHQEYETETITVQHDFHTEVEERTVNRAPTAIDKWMHQDEEFFMRRHMRVIEHARELWRMSSSPTAIREEEWFFATGGLILKHEDEAAARAINLLRRARSLVTRWEWEMFENVVRWNEPYGFPGSRLFGDNPRREEWAKLVVRKVAETISRSLFL